MKNTARGLALAGTAGILWALCSPVSKLLGVRGVDMSTVVFWRLLGTSVCVGMWLYLRSPETLRISRKEALWIFLFSPISTAGLYLGFALSVVYLPVATALVLHYTFPVVTALCSSLCTGEKPSRGDLEGAVLVTLGVFCSVLSPQWRFDAGLSVPGVLWGILAVAGISGQTLWGRAAVIRGGATGLAVLVYSHLFGTFWIALYKTAFVGWSDVLGLSRCDWASILLLLAASSIGAYSVYMIALKYIPASTASLAASVEIVAAVAMTSVFVVHRWPTEPEVLGCLLIIAAIGLSAWQGNRILKNARDS